MPIRLSGLTSGLDTDAIVKEMVSAYSMKTEKYEKAQTKLEWKQDIWKGLNTKIYSLYQNVSNLRYSSAYSLRKTTVSDNTKAKVTASSDAVAGTQKLNIIHTAQAGYITGGELKKGITADSKLSDLGYTAGNGTIEVKKNDGTTKQIKVTNSTTVSDFVNSLKDAGLNASFDANNRRIFVSAKESGVANDFALNSTNENGEAALKALGLDTAFVEKDSNGNYVFTQAAAGYKAVYGYYEKATDVDGNGTIDAQDVKAYLKSQVDLYDQYTRERNVANGRALKTAAENRELEEKIAVRKAYDSLDSAITEKLSTYGVTVDDIQSAAGEDGKLEQAELESLLQAKAPDADPATITTEAESFLATEGLEADLKKVNEYEVEAEDGTIPNAADLNISEMEATIEANKVIIAEAEALRAEKEAAMSGLGLDINDIVRIRDDEEEGGEIVAERVMYELAEKTVRANEILTSGNYLSGGATKVDGCDAEIRLNGVLYTSSTNSFSVNGLTIEATGVTGDGDSNAISINTTIDTQGVYDKIKDFLTEYNNVINEMTKLYNAESARDYEPLTDEEKEAMSDDQIEKWENKIKDSLLRRDTTLNGVMNAMVTSMAQTIDIGGQKLSLSTFGIGTLGFLNAPENENYAYHIDGDEDDENTSGKEDKLMAAIQENPEQVCEFMKQLTANLYTAIDNKMKSTSLSSAYKVYNDKEMDKQITEYKSIISKWEEKVSDREEYYYKKFSQMESALSKLQNQTNSLTGLFSS